MTVSFVAVRRGGCQRRADDIHVHPAKRTPWLIITRDNRIQDKVVNLASPGPGTGGFMLAEDRGFEPLRALTQPAFQASAIGH